MEKNQSKVFIHAGQRGQTPRTHGLKKVIRKNVKKILHNIQFFLNCGTFLGKIRFYLEYFTELLQRKDWFLFSRSKYQVI